MRATFPDRTTLELYSTQLGAHVVRRTVNCAHGGKPHVTLAAFASSKRARDHFIATLARLRGDPIPPAVRYAA